MSIVEPPLQTDYAALQDLYDRGRYLRLYETARDAGLLQQWPGVRGGILAARTAMQLGGTRQGNAILRRLCREAPRDPEVRYFTAYWQLQQKGPYRVWRQFQENLDLGPAATPETKASWYALIGETAAFFRDFETAKTWVRKGETLDAENPWIHVSWAHLYELEDRYEEALAAANRCLEIRPMYRAGVQAAGHLLTLLNRDDEAVELLRTALETVECAPLAAQLCALQMELQDYEGARAALDQAIRLAPLAERSWRKWVAAQRSELAYHDEDLPAAISQAKAADTPFFREVAASLEAYQNSGQEHAPIVLQVPFVRQHHVTCAPATLSALSRFWKKPAEHVQVADEICYNGTTSHAERQWAMQNGWAVKEFTVTADSARQTLERGIPFTLTTIEPGNAHLQALIGYDPRRGTLHIRDPYFRSSGETTTSKFLERYSTFGPRGMAMVPVESAQLLDGLELPDQELWDLLHELDGALIKHRRSEAEGIYNKLCERAPGHRLTLDARRRLAIYDFNPTDQLAAVEQWLNLFPGDDRLLWEQLGLMRYQTSREQRLERLAELCDKRESHPIFWRQYASELYGDARRHAEVERLLIKAMRRWPTDAANYNILANIRWDQRRWDEALELYRFAACLGDKDEQYFSTYFSAAVWVGQTEPLVAMLRERYQRLGKKSMLPAKTLATALTQLHRESEALALLEEAMTLRPDDGALLLCAADMYFAASHAHLPRAQQLLNAARELVPRLDWLRTSARLANAAGDSAGALRDWQEIAALQPLATEAHQAVARLLAETQGQRAAIDYLAAACSALPHHYSLHVVWAEWLRDEPPEVREPVLRRMLSLAPDDAWLRRELAGMLGEAKRYDEAWEQTEIAGKLEPYNPSFPYLQATLHKNQNNLAEAKTALRAAIRLSVDADFAIDALLNICSTAAERRAALGFVRDELVRQVTTGDGLRAFRNHAADLWNGEELLAELQKAHAARPDLWHAWSVLSQQYLLLNRLDEALDLAARACESFPLVPRLWTDLAAVHRARLDFAAERSALEKALQVNPGWSVALQSMCESLNRERLFDKCREYAERAIVAAPLDPFNHLQLAETLWELEEREQALARIRQVVQIEPGLESAWDLLRYWSRQAGQPELADAAMRELTEKRGGEVRTWLFLARMYDQPEQLPEALAAIDKALELNPRSTDAHDTRAMKLAKAGKYREALAACRPAIFASQVPVELQARSAWVESERGDLPAAIKRLREVLQDAPDNYNYWRCLADWCQRSSDNPGYLAAAETMAKLRPQSADSLGYLGEARLQCADRAGAKQAFARAFELAPAYEFAGSSLFDLQLEAGDLAGAAETVAIQREHSDSPFVIARAVQLAARQGDFEGGLQTLAELCLIPAQSRWPLNTAVGALVERGYASAVERQLEKVLQHDSVQPDVSRYWMELVIERLQENPYNSLAQLEAIERRMPRTPAYAAAWMRLGELYHDQQLHAATLRVALAIKECSPDVAMTYGYLGEAYLDNGDKPSAIREYERAVELDPSYEFASNSLFSLYLEMRDADKIQKLIDKLENERVSSLLLMRKVQLAALQENAVSAELYLDELCRKPLDPPWTLRYAVIALEEAQMQELAGKVLARVCQGGDAQEEVERYHAQFKAKRDALGLQRELPALLDKPGIGENSLEAWFSERIGNGHNTEVVRFIHQHKAKLLARVKLWGQVVWAGSRMRDYKLVNEFGQHWKRYAAPEPWMLVNVAEGYRHVGDDASGAEVSRHALTLPADNGTSLHALWLATDAACAGQFEQALELTERIKVEPDRLDVDYRFLHDTLECVLQLAFAEPSRKQAKYKQVQARLREIYGNYKQRGLVLLEPARIRLFYAARKQISQIMGTWSAWLWYYFGKMF